MCACVVSAHVRTRVCGGERGALGKVTLQRERSHPWLALQHGCFSRTYSGAGSAEQCSRLGRRKKLCLFTWVINPSLNNIIQGKSTWSFFLPQVGVHLRSQHLSHVVIMLAEVRVLLLRRKVHLQLVVRVTERHDCVHLHTDETMGYQWQSFKRDQNP